MTDPDPAISATDGPLKPALRSRTIGATAWTFAGYGVQQGLRLASNLILTRLLAPQIFGLMSVVQILFTGIEMLSDVGITPAIIQNPRADTPGFLNTAWTIQVIRGLALGVIAAALAWPAAFFFHQPELRLLMVVAALIPVVRGFCSTRIASENRHLALGRLTVMEIVVQCISLISSIAAAYVLRSVWALLIGWVISEAARLLASYTLLRGIVNRFEWDRQSARELVHVGRWVILSTAVTFCAGYLDRLAVGRLLSVKELGVYSIAYFLSNAVVTVVRTIGSRVLFPVLSETIRDTPHLFKMRLHKIRWLWVLPTTVALLVLVAGGPWLVKLMYRRDYWEAGWMLRVLAAGSIMMVLNQSYGIVWPALGEFRTITLLMMIQVPVLCVLMMCGHHLNGIVGFVVGVALVELVIYPVHMILIGRRKLWQPWLDLPVMAVGAALVVIFR